MLNLMTGGAARLCEGPSRRDILRAGSLGAFGAGLGLADLLAARGRADSETGSSFGKAKSCIVLFLMGGPPQHSTWDPKPDAPEAIRGAFGPIDSNVPGVQVCELMPMTARVMDRVCVLRAVSTGDNAHSSSGYYMLTGTPHTPKNFENANPGPPNDHPHLGAVLGRIAGGRGGLPPAVRLPHKIFNTDGSVWPGQDAGFLGRAADPWLLNAAQTPDGYRIDEIGLPVDLGPDRIDSRRDLRDRIARRLDFLDRAEAVHAFDRQTLQAYDLLRNDASRRAFRVEDEPEEVQERYGKTPFGQGVLLSRRLVEAGVRLVQVNWYRGPDEPSTNPCWDSHNDETNRLRDVLVPPMDRATSALIEDLTQRGLLDETLVVSMAEFGRSPRLDAADGRGHWGSVFSVALAGGGIKGGIVHGASDAVGGQPRDGLVRPEDLFATIFHCLGIPPDTEYRDPLDRPFPASRGEVIRGIV